MRIAITSQNFRTITGHAGKNCRFLVLEGSAGGEPREVKRLDLPRELAFHPFQNEGSHPVDGCDVIITQSCGAGFVQRLAARGIRVVVTSETDPYRAASALLRDEALPPPDPRSHHHHGHCQCHH